MEDEGHLVSRPEDLEPGKRKAEACCLPEWRTDPDEDIQISGKSRQHKGQQGTTLSGGSGPDD